MVSIWVSLGLGLVLELGLVLRLVLGLVPSSDLVLFVMNRHIHLQFNNQITVLHSIVGKECMFALLLHIMSRFVK